jgi:hypothetical protein
VIHSSDKKIEIYTDLTNLTKYALFKIKQTRHLEWYKTLSKYSFIIKHIPGSDNDFADKLSRPTGTSKKDEETKNVFTSEENSNMNTIKNNTETEEEEVKTSKKIYNQMSNNNITTLTEQNEIIDDFYTSKVNIHPGIIGTLKLIRKYYQ